MSYCILNLKWCENRYLVRIWWLKFELKGTIPSDLRYWCKNSIASINNIIFKPIFNSLEPYGHIKDTFFEPHFNNNLNIRTRASCRLLSVPIKMSRCLYLRTWITIRAKTSGYESRSTNVYWNVVNVSCNIVMAHRKSLGKMDVRMTIKEGSVTNSVLQLPVIISTRYPSYSTRRLKNALRFTMPPGKFSE